MTSLRVFLITLAAVTLACAQDSEARRRTVAPQRFVVIDLMELYTRDAPPDIEHKIRTAVANLNADMIRSGITNVQFNLVYVGPTDTIDMARPDIHDLRDRYRADLVGIWSPIANESGGMSLVPDRTNPLPYTGFHDLPTNQDANAPMFTHEVGHNLGLMHEDGICRAEQPAFHDIMSQCEGVVISGEFPTYVRAFTNSEMTYMGLPFIGETDAAAVIREMAPKIAAYR